MAPQTAQQSIETLVMDLRSKRDRLIAETQDLEQDIAAAERTLILLGVGQAHVAEVRHGSTTAEDIAGCKTQREALYELAKRNQGIVKVTDAAKLIKEAGLSEGKPSSIGATLHNFMSSSDDWEWAAPGAFRIVNHPIVKGRSLSDILTEGLGSISISTPVIPQEVFQRIPPPRVQPPD